MFQKSLAIRQAMKDKRGQALCLRYLGETAQAQGNMDLAQQDLERSLALFRGIGSQDETSATLNSLGQLALSRQDQLEAQRYFTNALRIAQEAATMPRILDAIVSLARLLANEDPQQSAQIAAAVQNHPAANRNSREQAGRLLEDLEEVDAFKAANMGIENQPAVEIETITNNLLTMFT